MNPNHLSQKSKKPARWTTVQRSAEIEFEEKRSRFIGLCFPIRDKAEAESELNAVRRRFPDATHHVFAWQTLFPENAGRYSDDGEPQGTAGLPVLDVLKKRGIDQAEIIVVRYFGGTLLGAGGLVRAYSRAAASALDAASPLHMCLRRKYRVMAPYDCYERLRYQLEKEGFYQEIADFGLDVEWNVSADHQREAELVRLLADQSAGAALMEFIGEDYSPEIA